MAFIHPPALRIPLLTFQPHSSSTRILTFFPKLLFKNPRNSLYIVSCSTPKAIPATEQEVLDAIAESDEKSLPAVRSFENDLARLTMVGAIDVEQALTAAAADGGNTADEHIASGMAAMVVETVFPGASDEHSTVSTRLFLPARKVKEKANRLRRSFTEDFLSSTTSKDILAMTFRQVVLQQLWNFELVLFIPGTERNMEELQDSRKVPASFSLSSSDEGVISVLAEVICISALQTTERHFLNNLLGQTSNNFFKWFHKPKSVASKDSSVIMYELFEDEIVENAKNLLENFNSMKANYKCIETKTKYHWWTSSAISKLEKIGGPEFSTWTSEYIPAYRLQIDPDKLKSVKFEGWKRSAENRWEVLLTHSQMVALANILDMYYEDLYTLPDKQLLCGAGFANFTNLSKNKRVSSLLKILTISIASGIFLVAINVLGRLYFPRVNEVGKGPGNQPSLLPSEINCVQHNSLETTKMEAFCISIVKKIKDAFGWSGEIMAESSVGAWTGDLPIYLRVDKANHSGEDISNGTALLQRSDEEKKTSTQDIASYQVVLSVDGEIVGFQPTSRVAVNNWAVNPLAKELYKGKKLSPGLFETGLKIPRPNEVVIIELLMSVNSDACFALARPVQ
ncbi:hypothetical protein AAG906_028450 [Vitis piasezkii]